MSANLVPFILVPILANHSVGSVTDQQRRGRACLGPALPYGLCFVYREILNVPQQDSHGIANGVEKKKRLVVMKCWMMHFPTRA